jgi:hypothetical protein
MKSLTIRFVIALAASAFGMAVVAPAQNVATTPPAAETNAATPDSETAAAGLDLHAVAELFKNSENLEKFEQALNDPQTGINNLDLDKNGEVDFIRVTEQVKDSTHLIILQTPLGENDFQDVATIAVEQESAGKINLQLQGDTALYGANYYVVPASNNFSAWNVMRWLFAPRYVAYVSPYSYRVLPRWWTVRRPVALNFYRNRTVAFVGRRNFVSSRVVTVRTLNKINYHPRAAAIVMRRPNAVRTPTVVMPAPHPRATVQTRTETTTRTGPSGQTTTTTHTQTRVVRGRRH